MTELLTALRARPGQRVHELAATLGRRGLVERVEGPDHVATWVVVDATRGAA